MGLAVSIEPPLVPAVFEGHLLLTEAAIFPAPTGT